MNLLDAMRRVAPCLDPRAPYVKAEGGMLSTYSGSAWMMAELDEQIEFCVRHDLLLPALAPGYAIEPFGEHGITVKVGRRRTRVHGVAPASIPNPVYSDVVTHIRPPEAFKALLKTMVEWIKPDTLTIWMQGVHLMPTCLWAANSHEAIRFDWELAMPELITLPLWACKAILASRAEPRLIYDRGNTLDIVFDDRSHLQTLKLFEGPPESAMRYVQGIAQATQRVLPELLPAVTDLLKYKANNCLIGQGQIATCAEDNDKLEVDDDIAIGGPVRRWRLEWLARALTWAEAIDLDTDGHCIWRGSGYTGTFVKMVL